MNGGQDALPRLRNDLKLSEGPLALDGSPTWIITDPVRNRFFSIGWAAFELLSRWSLGSARALLESLEKDTTVLVSAADIEALITFLKSNSLTLDPPTGSHQDYYKQYMASRQNPLLWLVHNYLFFRLPLVRPTRFLRRTLPYVEPLFSTTFRALVALCGLTGLYVVGRQWDQFTSTFLFFFNAQGIAFYGVALIFTKIMHELAHAYTTVRYGCRVPTMGVAFLVMFPVLYTDTSDTWRVRDPIQRMHIGGAGMLMEIYIACLATFAWGLLPEGHLQSATFVLATTSWVLSLFVNLNPCMRFDGYHIFADLVGVQNLQMRSFAFGKWSLRELLFGLGFAPPEAVSRRLQRILIVYAWCTWVYRLLLFLGIAVLVYHYFFKLLGILLFSIEIIWFILLPMVREAQHWWQIRDRIGRSARLPLLLAVVVCGVVFVTVPWSTSVRVPAIHTAATTHVLFAPAPANIGESRLQERMQVSKGQVLVILRSPEIENEIAKTRLEIDLQTTRARRIAASPEELEESRVIAQQLGELRSRLDGLEEKRDQLTIRAPFAGEIRDVEDSLHEGRWISDTLPLATLVDTGEEKVIAMIAERDLGRIELANEARFIPEDAEMPIVNGVVSDIDVVNSRVISVPEFASVYGGMLPTRVDEHDRIVPEGSYYRLSIDPERRDDAVLDQTVRGVAHIRGERKSYLARFYQTAVSVLVRESGF